MMPVGLEPAAPRSQVNRSPFGQRNVATYIHNICKGHLESWGWNRVVKAKDDIYNNGQKSTALSLYQASTVHKSKIDGFMRCRTIVYLQLSVVFPCILLIIARTVRGQDEF